MDLEDGGASDTAAARFGVREIRSEVDDALKGHVFYVNSQRARHLLNLFTPCTQPGMHWPGSNMCGLHELAGAPPVWSPTQARRAFIYTSIYTPAWMKAVHDHSLEGKAARA